MAIYKVICKQNPYQNQRNGCNRYHDDRALSSVISYVLREDKTQNQYIGAYGVGLTFPAEEMAALSRAYGKDSGLRLRHSVFSFGDSELSRLGGTEEEIYQAAYRIADHAAGYYKDRYQIVYAVHQDGGHLNCHLVMNTVSYVDGLKYTGKKKDLYGFMDYMRDFLETEYDIGILAKHDQ